MGVSYLFDTSVLIEFERAPASWSIDEGAGWAISAMTLAELNLGVLRARTASDRQRRLETYMIASQTRVLDLDRPTSRTYAELVAWAETAGVRPATADAMIAATAATHGLELVTFDHGFAQLAAFDGLELVLL